MRADPSSAPDLPPIDYSTRFVGRLPRGGAAFADRVAGALARHPSFAAATPGEGAPLHLELTLTNTSNNVVAALTGLASGFSLTLLPAYARDELALVVEVRAGDVTTKRVQYHDAVKTFVHFTAMFTPPASQPRTVVEDVVDTMVMHALHDLEASGALAPAVAGADANEP